MPNNARKALLLVVLLGTVSLFADMTYEAARSVSGPFLAVLGASGTVVGVVAGLGELVGYGLRVVFGVLSDRTRRYWTITIAGYAVNLLAVPALALAGHWEIAAVLMMTERLGKAIRTPARDAMLSYATSQIGRGWGFGLHEAMDQVGAVIGPLIVVLALARHGSYPFAFAVLAIPALLALAALIVARVTYPHPHALETALPVEKAPFRLTFWLYLIGIGFVAAGFADFPLVAYHVKSIGTISDEWIPLVYSGAMALDAASALIFGRLYDRVGLPILIIVVGISAWFAPFAFSGNVVALLVGMAMWGIGLGAQESIVRAVVSEITPNDRRATGYGIFNTGFGIAWFAGSAVMGILYGRSIALLVTFSVITQLVSLPVLYAVHRRLRAGR